MTGVLASLRENAVNVVYLIGIFGALVLLLLGHVMVGTVLFLATMTIGKTWERVFGDEEDGPSGPPPLP